MHCVCLHEKRLVDLLAQLEHQQWIEWSKTIAKTEKISKSRLQRWNLCWKSYWSLPEETKEQDRKWARKVLKIVRKASLPPQAKASGIREAIL
jgi:hypothetical protein